MSHVFGVSDWLTWLLLALAAVWALRRAAQQITVWRRRCVARKHRREFDPRRDREPVR